MLRWRQRCRRVASAAHRLAEVLVDRVGLAGVLRRVGRVTRDAEGVLIEALDMFHLVTKYKGLKGCS